MVYANEPQSILELKTEIQSLMLKLNQLPWKIYYKLGYAITGGGHFNKDTWALINKTLQYQFDVRQENVIIYISNKIANKLFKI